MAGSRSRYVDDPVEWRATRLADGQWICERKATRSYGLYPVDEVEGDQQSAASSRSSSTTSAMVDVVVTASNGVVMRKLPFAADAHVRIPPIPFGLETTRSAANDRVAEALVPRTSLRVILQGSEKCVVVPLVTPLIQDACSCTANPLTNGATVPYLGCADHLHQSVSFWCYVNGGTSCSSATPSSITGAAWQECDGTGQTVTPQNVERTPSDSKIPNDLVCRSKCGMLFIRNIYGKGMRM